MKTKNLHFVWKKSTFILALSCAVSATMIISSFRAAEDGGSYKEEMICNGPFYTSNVLGSTFAILGPGGAGAPNEAGTCGRSGGCHNTVDNSGPGTLTIDIGGGATQYVPGQTYTVTVTIDQSGITAFDFEVTNRASTSTTNAVGTFLITDAARTKKTSGYFGGAGSNYVEGTACGVDVISSGHNEWTFDWKAPTTAVGNITFYLGAVAANFNNSQSGDYTYSKKVVLQGPTGINDLDDVIDFKQYPNPVTEHFFVDFTLNKECNVAIKMFDIAGRETSVLLSEKEKPGKYHHSFNVSGKNYTPGFYVIQTSIDGQVSGHKLLIQ